MPLGTVPCSIRDLSFHPINAMATTLLSPCANWISRRFAASKPRHFECDSAFPTIRRADFVTVIAFGFVASSSFILVHPTSRIEVSADSSLRELYTGFCDGFSAFLFFFPHIYRRKGGTDGATSPASSISCVAGQPPPSLTPSAGDVLTELK